MKNIIFITFFACSSLCLADPFSLDQLRNSQFINANFQSIVDEYHRSPVKMTNLLEQITDEGVGHDYIVQIDKQIGKNLKRGLSVIRALAVGNIFVRKQLFSRYVNFFEAPDVSKYADKVSEAQLNDLLGRMTRSGGGSSDAMFAQVVDQVLGAQPKLRFQAIYDIVRNIIGLNGEDAPHLSAQFRLALKYCAAEPSLLHSITKKVFESQRVSSYTKQAIISDLRTMFSDQNLDLNKVSSSTFDAIEGFLRSVIDNNFASDIYIEDDLRLREQALIAIMDLAVLSRNNKKAKVANINNFLSRYRTRSLNSLEKAAFKYQTELSPDQRGVLRDTLPVIKKLVQPTSAIHSACWKLNRAIVKTVQGLNNLIDL
jgi:hypothetical protein